MGDFEVDKISGTVSIFRLAKNKGIAGFVVPGHDGHEIRYKRRYGALEKGGVTANHIFVVYFRFVLLLHNCGDSMFKDSIYDV